MADQEDIDELISEILEDETLTWEEKWIRKTMRLSNDWDILHWEQGGKED